MKTISFLLAFILYLFIPKVLFANDNLLDLNKLLEECIDKTQSYNEIREKRIRELMFTKQGLKPFSNEEYNVNGKLFNEYKSYQSDSAIHYLNQNIRIAQFQKDKSKEYACKTDLAYLFGSIAMYKEAIDLLESINPTLITEIQTINYHYAYLKVYGEIAYYTQDKSASVEYWKIYNNHLFSVKKLLSVDDDLFHELMEDSLRNTKNFDKALKINDLLLAKTKQGTHEYAKTTFRRALIYIYNGDKINQQYYLTLSAISDIQSTVNDQASIMLLASLLFEQGNIDLAYKYIRFSWEATQFYNAKLRSLQNSTILSIVDKTYQSKIESQNTKLLLYLLLISSLVILLLVSLLIIYRQKQKISYAKIELQNANVELVKLNNNLKILNDNLFIANNSLNESNHIKEVYIGRFIELSSIYINKIDDFRKKINNSIKAGKIKEIDLMSQSQDIMDEEFAELYTYFDNAFLQLFPNFVEQVNELLNIESRFDIKKGDLLIPELRIIALMRLGINEGNKISHFLRYSLTTVYNFRTKTKNRTYLNKDEFDKKIMEIK